ncbi:MAG: type II toxin-antitoxin system RelE/ParE family toxin [Oscillospiraceae bacterium]|nr:type II toxin-antitoxin system RelE/ParE family toxin [Oscillospiraceae bacterium]
MEKFNVNLSEFAENELRDIARYISNQLNAPRAALDLIQLIKLKTASLETMAMAYPLVRDERLATLGYRSVTVKNYTLFYIADEEAKQVDIVRILWSRRNWQNIL